MRSRAYAMLLLHLCLLLIAQPTLAEEADGLFGNLFAPDQYSVYALAGQDASAQETRAVLFVQYLPAYEGPAIEGFVLYAQGTPVATATAVTGWESDGRPLWFEAAIPLPEGPVALTVIPVAGGSEVAEAAFHLLPDTAENAPVGLMGMVRSADGESRLNLRMQPDAGAASLRHYTTGVPVRILAKHPGGWYAVAIGNPEGMARGYMMAEFIAIKEDAQAVPSRLTAVLPTVDSWTLYGLPDEASPPVGDFGATDAFEVLGESSAWWHIRVGGQTGFVRANVLTAAVETARSQEDTTPTPLVPADDRLRTVGDVTASPDAAGN